MTRNAPGSWTALFASCMAAALTGCQPPAVDVASEAHSTRWVVLPSAIASLSSDHDTQGVPAEIRLGDPFGRSLLYLKFPRAWPSAPPDRPLQAFLTLTPSDDAASDRTPIAVEVWRVKSDWQAGALHAWSEKPPLGPPFAGARTSAPPREVRIDVSELVRFAARDPERDFGLAVLSKASDGRGATFSTGSAGGRAPRLELYLR